MSFPPPPFGTVWELATTYWLSRCLHVATEIGVADALGPEPARPDALASSVGVNADALFRIVRLLAAHDVLEVKDGRIAHTPASEILRTDHPQSMRAFVRVMGVPAIWSAYGEPSTRCEPVTLPSRRPCRKPSSRTWRRTRTSPASSTRR